MPSYPLHQQNQLFRNDNGRYKEVTDSAGSGFALSEVSRGAVFGDIDNDGDTDVLITNNAGPARLLLNGVGSTNAWIGLRLVDEGGKRDMLGTLVAIENADGNLLWRRIRADGSYASSNDPRVVFGLGNSKNSRQDVLVVWPDGTREHWTSLTTGRYNTLRRGTGMD